MAYDKELVAAKLGRWETYLTGFSLPAWEQLPQLELYMDQVVELVSRYLNFLPPDERGNPPITASTVNNYVRLKMMPPPVKKRYGRVHLAYLIMICTLKQSVNMNYIQKMLPLGLSPREVEKVYTDYAARHKKTCQLFLEQVKHIINDSASLAEEGREVEDMVFSWAILAGLNRLLTEKMIALQDKHMEDFIWNEEAPSEKNT